MWRLLFLATFLTVTAFSQSPDAKLQGTWLCTDITTADGHPAIGEFGTARNYLRFKFEGNKLFISHTPFDVGCSVRVRYGEDYFELLNTQFSQTEYKIKRSDDETLELETQANKKQKIIYRFVSGKKYLKDLDQISNTRHYEKIILQTTKSELGYYLNSFYLIDNSILNLLPCPQFVTKEYSSLGVYLESNLNFKLGTLLSLTDKESVFEFDVTSQGIENISIVERLGDEVDFRIFDIVRGMSKMWEPLIVDGKPMITRIRLTVSFTYKEQ